MLVDDDRFDWRSLLDALHASPFRVAIVVAGGGAGALAECFRHEGASKTFVDACIPYSRRAMTEYLGAEPRDASAAGKTARQLAEKAFARGQSLDDGDGDGQYAGVALVAALPTTQPRRGADRIHVALHTRETSTLWSTELEKGAYTRESAETVADDLVQIALADLVGQTGLRERKHRPQIKVERQTLTL